jgi:hypothetical protein
MHKLVFALSVLLLLAVPKINRAGHLVPLTIEQLAQQSELVLEGTVLSKSCQRDPAGRIYTKVELSVADVWKGAVPARPFTIVHGGGVLGDNRVTVSDQVDFQPGEEVVVFLVINQRGEGVSLGMAQGKFHVWINQTTKLKYARNSFHGGTEAGGSSTQQSVAEPRLTLADLKRRVRGGLQ